MNNPFGAFFGLAFPITFSFQTIQQTIREPVVLNPDGGRPMPGVVSQFKRSNVLPMYPGIGKNGR